MVTLDEAISYAEEVAEENEKVVNTRTFEDGHTVDEMYCDDTECIDAHLSRCAKCAKEHRQLSEWLKDYKWLLEQEPCEDEYIKVPKKALKYRTAGMVAYNAEWLKNHFDIERAVICGEQEPCEDCVRLEQAEVKAYFDGQSYGWDECRKDVLDKIRAEIMQVANQEKFYDEKWALGLRHAVKIIDKYAESEEA